jgi:hypothetical protein
LAALPALSKAAAAPITQNPITQRPVCIKIANNKQEPTARAIKHKDNERIFEKKLTPARQTPPA